MQIIKTLQILDIKKLKNSTSGNPQYRFIFKSENGQGILEATTKSNAGFVYSLSPQPKEIYNILYHTTPKGKNIIDNMQLLEENNMFEFYKLNK